LVFTGKFNQIQPSREGPIAVLGNDWRPVKAGEEPIVHPELQSNPFALPPSKKQRALDDETMDCTTPALAQTGECQPAANTPAAHAVPKRIMKPTVRFSDRVQVQPAVAHTATSTKFKPCLPFAAMTPTYGSYRKRLQAEEEDPISDVEEDLQVMDTPTSSQQGLVRDHEMEDDEVEIVNFGLPGESFGPSNHCGCKVLPDILIDQLSVETTHHSTQTTTPSHVWQGTANLSGVQYPLPAQTIPLTYRNNIDARYQPGSPSEIRKQINSKRHDMHAEIQQLIADTEDTRQEVVNLKEVSSPRVWSLNVSFIGRILHGGLLRTVQLHIISEPPQTTCNGRSTRIQ
jgi:hypothetical protein